MDERNTRGRNPRLAPDATDPLRFPEEDEVICKDCIYRAKDIANGTIKGATLGVCDAYPIKPPSILLDGAECMYYCSEDEDEE